MTHTVLGMASGFWQATTMGDSTGAAELQVSSPNMQAHEGIAAPSTCTSSGNNMLYSVGAEGAMITSIWFMQATVSCTHQEPIMRGNWA